MEERLLSLYKLHHACIVQRTGFDMRRSFFFRYVLERGGSQEIKNHTVANT